MNQSSNGMDGAHQFHLKAEKLESGETKVSCPAHPEVPAVTAPKHQTAVSLFRQQMEKATSNGKVRGQ